MEKSKISAYLGFCLRARKVVFGVDEIENKKKGVYLLICDEQISQNSLKNVVKARETLGCPLLLAKADALGQALHKPAVKAVAIQDKNLALAILSAVESEDAYNLYSGGSN